MVDCGRNDQEYGEHYVVSSPVLCSHLRTAGWLRAGSVSSSLAVIRWEGYGGLNKTRYWPGESRSCLIHSHSCCAGFFARNKMTMRPMMSKGIPSRKKGLWASSLSSISVLLLEDKSLSKNSTFEFGRLLFCTLPDSNSNSLTSRI